MDGGSVDFAGASHRPDSLADFVKQAPHCLHSYEISGLNAHNYIYIAISLISAIYRASPLSFFRHDSKVKFKFHKK